jgi:mannose-1-phosphate guanylyltransferase
VENRNNIYLVVTATGRKNGLSELTRKLHGCDVPKALAMVASEGSLLQQSVSSFSQILDFRGIIALVPEREEERARDQLEPWTRVEVATVPASHGLASALLLPLSEILTKSPHAEIVVVSADCYVPDPRPFVDALDCARAQLGLVTAVLLGAVATGPEDGRRWLVPGLRLGEEIFTLSDSRIPTSEEECAALVAQGAMWNTSTFIARGQFLLRVLARALPLQADAIARARRAGRSSPAELAEVLTGFAPASCSVDLDELIMEEVGTIAVARVKGSGWDDWKTPERVFRSLPSHFERAWLSSRLSAGSSTVAFASGLEDGLGSQSAAPSDPSR